MKLTRTIVPTLIAVALGLAALPASPASAHADYDTSSPGRGEQLAVGPPEIEITFTQEVQKVAGSYDITVNKDRGLSVTAGPAVVNDADRMNMSVPLQPNLEDGRYVVNWSNVSDADGDANLGAFSFYLNHTPTAVDLANDAALEQIGPADETPPVGETPGTSASPETAAPTEGAATETTDPTPAATADSGDDDEGGGSGAAIFIVIAVVAIVALAGAAFVVVRSRSS